MSFNIMEVVSVTSETLQRKIRELLPSQQGFGADLQASNVIIPIVDLTAAAEGSDVPVTMQQAIAFGSQTAFSINNTTTVIANSPGFYRIFGVCNLGNVAGAGPNAEFSLSDGLSTKTALKFESFNFGTGTNELTTSNLFDFVVFLAAGESLSGIVSSSCSLIGSSRQIADVNGTLTNPSGFNPQ